MSQGGFGSGQGGYGPPAGPGWPEGGVYQPPGTAPSPAGPSPAGSWSPSEAIGFGWRAVTGDYVGVGLPLAVIMLVTTGAGAVLGGIFGVLQVVVEKALSAGGVPDPMVHAGMSVGMSLIQNVIGFVIQALVMGGIVDFCLQVARGNKASFGVVFGGARYFVPMLVGAIVLGLGVAFGILLCLVPGIILALGCMLWQYVVVDRGVGGVDALKESWKLTGGHKGTLFGFAVLACLVMLAGVLACCVGALLLSWPVLGMATAYIYLKLRGEEPSLPPG
jgi:uncharacterized membrane protein